jgi:hypothetical protein
LGVAGKKGKRKFYTLLSPNVNSLFKAEASSGFTEIECTTLKDIFILNKIRKCDFLKVDCEGAEYEILFSLPKEFFKRIERIALEYHDEYCQFNHEELARYLEKQGFEIKSVPHQREENVGFFYAKQKK